MTAGFGPFGLVGHDSGTIGPSHKVTPSRLGDAPVRAGAQTCQNLLVKTSRNPNDQIDCKWLIFMVEAVSNICLNLVV